MKNEKKRIWWLLVILMLAAGIGAAYHFWVPDTSGQIVKGAANQNSLQGKKALIVYFAYSENIGDTSAMDVDAIASASLHGEKINPEGDLQVMVKELQKKTGADTYSIVVKHPYPAAFDDMTERAKEEIEQKQETPLKDPIPDLSAYDVIYLGTPIWWYDLPAPVSTFLREADLSGKTVVPFGIHRGSGFLNNLEKIRSLQPGIQMTDGFTIDARTPNQEVRQQFDAFLEQFS